MSIRLDEPFKTLSRIKRFILQNQLTVKNSYSIIPLYLVAVGIYQVLTRNYFTVTYVFPHNPIINYYGLPSSFIMFGIFFFYINYTRPISGLGISVFTFCLFEIVDYNIYNPLMIIFAFFAYFSYTYIKPQFTVNWKYLSLFLLVTLILVVAEYQEYSLTSISQIEVDFNAIFDIPYTFALFIFIFKSLKPCPPKSHDK